jgi:signal peptidase I
VSDPADAEDGIGRHSTRRLSGRRSTLSPQQQGVAWPDTPAEDGGSGRGWSPYDADPPDAPARSPYGDPGSPTTGGYQLTSRTAPATGAAYDPTPSYEPESRPSFRRAPLYGPASPASPSTAPEPGYGSAPQTATSPYRSASPYAPGSADSTQIYGARSAYHQAGPSSLSGSLPLAEPASGPLARPRTGSLPSRSAGSGGLGWLDGEDDAPAPGRRQPPQVSQRQPSPASPGYGIAGPPVGITTPTGELVVPRHATGGIQLGSAGLSAGLSAGVGPAEETGAGPASGVPVRGPHNGYPLPGEAVAPALRRGRLNGSHEDGAGGWSDDGGWGGDGGGSGGGGESGPEPDSGSGSGRRGTGRGRKQTPFGRAVGAVVEVVVVVALALVLALIIKTFLVQAFFIPSESMENTLLTGDRVLVSKLTPGMFGLHRGDIVVFKDPGGWLPPTAPVDEGPLRNGVRTTLTFVGLLPQDSGEHLIKRVIGLPGDHVQCCDAKGRVMVNGVPIDETYLYPGNTPSDKIFDVTVTAGNLWVMGDHRSVSEDSRWHPQLNNGMVPEKDVVGKAFVVVWPLDRAATLGVPDSVFARVPSPPSPGP